MSCLALGFAARCLCRGVTYRQGQGKEGTKEQKLPLQLFIWDSRRPSPAECVRVLHRYRPSVSSACLSAVQHLRFVANITAELQQSKPCKGVVSRELMERELGALNRDRESIEKRLGLLLPLFAGAPVLHTVRRCACMCNQQAADSQLVTVTSPSLNCGKWG